MIIRKMISEDAAVVAAIEKEVFSLPWSEQSFRDAALKEANIYLVAELDGEVAGYAGAWGVFGEADITNVCVAPKYRKMGIADKLLNELLDIGRENNIDVFFLEVRESNQPAISLYEKNGFRKISIRKNFYERPVENAIVMSKMFI